MEEFITYLIPILILTLVVVSWGGIQFVAKRMNVKNHIDHAGCCGACENRSSCEK